MEKLENLMIIYDEFIKDEDWDCLMILKKKTHDSIVVSSVGNLSDMIPIFTNSEFVNIDNKSQADEIQSIRDFILNAAANILVNDDSDRAVFMAGVHGAINSDKYLN